jgi:hypothetical protein
MMTAYADGNCKIGRPGTGLSGAFPVGNYANSNLRTHHVDQAYSSGAITSIFVPDDFSVVLLSK